jgi:replicative DNA helicase
MNERSLAERFAALPEARRKKILASLSTRERAALEFTWEFWARPKQLEPQGDWRVWMLCAGRGFGKALALDTPIPTPSGWKTMGELQVGDEVFDEQGRACRVTFATDAMHGHDCFDVVFSDGTVITADAEHQWLTWTLSARQAEGRERRRPSSRRERSTQPCDATFQAGCASPITPSHSPAPCSALMPSCP